MKIRLIHLFVILNAIILINAAQKNPYKVLGINQNASDEQIKQRFRELSKKYHPDVNRDPKASEFFQEITAAYQTLTDPNSKQKYFDEVERQQYKQQQGGHYSWSNFGYQGYQQSSSSVKQQNYRKKWNELFQKKNQQSYATYFNNKKRTYKPVGSSKLGWIKDKISVLLFSGGIGELLIYGVIIIFVIKIFGSMVHVQMG